MPAGASPQTPLGELTVLPQASWLVSRGLLRGRRRTKGRGRTTGGEEWKGGEGEWERERKGGSSGE